MVHYLASMINKIGYWDQASLTKIIPKASSHYGTIAVGKCLSRHEIGNKCILQLNTLPSDVNDLFNDRFI